MKKLTLITLSIIAFFIFATPRAEAQNIQLHYDTTRDCMTSTVEMFRPDFIGSTFFFIDLDYSPKVKGAYMELAREFNFWQESKLSWLSLHLEYNGGMDLNAGSYNNSWLGGLTYSGHSADFSKTWSLSAMYKAIPGTKDANDKKQVHNFQLTGVWGISFAKGWLSFSGFADYWREVRAWQDTKFIFLAEPQLWVNLNKIRGWDKINISVGSEVEISNNFVKKGFEVMPTIAVKWSFK